MLLSEREISQRMARLRQIFADSRKNDREPIDPVETETFQLVTDLGEIALISLIRIADALQKGAGDDTSARSSGVPMKPFGGFGS